MAVKATHRVWHNDLEKDIEVCDACAERINKGEESSAFDGNKVEPLVGQGRFRGWKCIFTRHPQSRFQ